MSKTKKARNSKISKIKKVVSYSLVGGFGLIMAGSLAGCRGENTTQEATASGAFVVLEEVAGGGYKILEEFPSAETRIILKKLDGTEKVLTKEEMDALVAAENEKIENGTSNLTNPEAQMSSGGMSLGEAVLASAAGALIGSYIGNKLFNNPAYQNQRQNAYKNPSSYQRSVDSFKNNQNQNTKRSSSGRSGFYGGGSKSSSVGG